MRIRSLLALAVLASLSVLFVILAAGPALGQTDPPASGDWTVSDTTVVMDQTVDLHGDLLVTDTGSLTLENVTLRIHLSSDGQYGIEVMGDGSLTIEDGDDDKATTSDASRVTAVPTTRSYYLIANTASVLRLTNSFITRCGHTGMAGATHQGIYVATDDAIVTGMAVDDCLQGLIVEDGSVTVSDSSFTNCTYHGITATNSDLNVGSTTLADKPELVVAAKLDLADSQEPARELARAIGVEVLPISAVTGLGLPVLSERLWTMLSEFRQEQPGRRYDLPTPPHLRNEQ